MPEEDHRFLQVDVPDPDMNERGSPATCRQQETDDHPVAVTGERALRNV